jgi:hypothetical protein
MELLLGHLRDVLYIIGIAWLGMVIYSLAVRR